LKFFEYKDFDSDNVAASSNVNPIENVYASYLSVLYSILPN